MLVVPSPSVFAYFSGLMLSGSESNKAQVWRVAIRDLLVFALASFVAAARNSGFMSNKADPCIVADGLSLLMAMSDRLAPWTVDLGSCIIVCKTESEPLLSYAAFSSGREVDWLCIDFNDAFFLHCWRTGR